jgi:hypothetical protein
MVKQLWPSVVLPAIGVLGICGVVNYIKFGSPFLSGYHQWHPEWHVPTGPVLAGLRGLLLWPRFSVFLYFPVFTLALSMTWLFLRRFPVEGIAAIGGFIVFLVGLAKIPTWPGEWTYGPRYLLFALPVASLPFLLLVDALIDNAQRHRALVGVSGLTIAAVLLYSAYLQFRVNQLDFFAYYYIRPPEYSGMDANYFESRPVGMIIDELRRHRDDLDSMSWFDALKKKHSEAEMEQYRQKVREVLARKNYYFGS